MRRGSCPHVVIMKIRSVTVALAVLVLVLPSIGLSAQSIQSNLAEWNNVKSVPPGDEIIVTLRNTQSIKGRLNVVSDALITLTKKKEQMNINRDEIVRVHRVLPKSAKGATLLGTGIGAIVGAGIGAGIGNDGYDDEGWAIAFLAGVGAGFGAIAGFLIGSGKLKVLVYEA